MVIVAVRPVSCHDGGCSSCIECLAADAVELARADDDAWLAARSGRPEASS